MTDQQLKTLGIVALVLFLVAAALYSGIDLFSGSFRSGTPLIQGLDTAKIATIEIKSKDHTATFQKAGDEFLLKEKNNYPASTEEINKLLIKVLEIRLDEKITDSADNHAELGVNEDGDEAVSIRLLDEEGNLLTGVVRGKGVERRSGIYVRRIDDDTVYSTTEYILFESDPLKFVDTELFDLEAYDIASVRVRTAMGDDYTIERLVTEPPAPAEGEKPEDPEVSYVLLTPPSGQEADEDECEEVAEYLVDLEFEDVIPAAERQIAWDVEYRCTLTNRLAYVVRTAKDGDDWYMAVGAVTPLQADQVSITRDESEEELKKKEALLLANDQAEAFNTLHTGWIYKINEDDADVLRTTLLSLVLSDDEDENE